MRDVPAAAALCPGFDDVEDSKPLLRRVRLMRAEDRLCDDYGSSLWRHDTCSLGAKL